MSPWSTRLPEERIPYRELFEANPEPMWVFDLETRGFLMVNDAAVARYGWSREEFGELTIDDIRPPEDVPALHEVLEGLPDGPERLEGWRHRTRSGRILEVDVSSHPLDFGGRPAILVQVHDLTERRAADRHRRLLSEAVGAAANAVFITDPEGVVEWVNPAFTRITGYSVEESVGRKPQELVKSGEHGDAFYEDLWTTIRSGRVWRGQVVNRRKDGSRYVANETITPVSEEHGRITHFVSVHEDITQRVSVEAELRERVKELRTLYQATRLLHDAELPFEERLRRVVAVLPPGMLYPEITEARITVGTVAMQTPGFRESPWTLSSDIPLGEGAGGRLELVLTEERPERDEGPFLKEERDLLDSIARAVAEARQRERITHQLAQTVAGLGEAVLVLESGEEGRKITSVNPAAERIFGYSAEEMVGRSPDSLLVSDEAARRFREEGLPLIEQEGFFRADYPMKRKDGSVFQAEQTTSFLEPARGLAGGVLGIIRDVSEAKRSEAELRASEERFRQIAERIEHVFWITDPGKTRMEYVSPGYRKIWGRDPAELYEDPSAWLEGVHPEDRERMRRASLHQASDTYDEEYRIVRPDGEVRWIHDLAFPVKGDEGEVEQIVGVAEDITKRKQAEERLEVLSREITEVIYILDPGGVVLFSTPSVGKATGYPQEEFEGMNALALVHGDDRERLRATLDEIAGTPDATSRAEYRIVTREGDVRHLESVARNLLDHPGVGGILVTSRDVTERVELEEKMHESQRLEAIGRLAGGIAHDFNNLLTVIRSETDLLLLDLEESDASAAELQVIQVAADRAATLTNQLLAFSRDQVLRPRVVILCEVVRSSVRLVQRLIGEDVKIEMDLPGDCPAVEVDPSQLEQVVLNLAVNARDAMPDGGFFRLRTFRDVVDETRTREMGDVEPGVYTVLEVSDTGVGMDEETRSRVFEPFFTTKGGKGGTGLGLSMAYGFVKQSGGSIRVESTPGEGTTFLLRFPVVEGVPDPSGPVQATERATDTPSGTVLVIEDNRSVRRIVVKILRRSGLEAVQAEDAEEGLDLLAGGLEVDLVLTDLGLPGISGRALIERLRERHPGLPIAAMSGYAADSPGQGDLPAEIPFLQKPFTPETLMEMVRLSLG